MISCMNSQSLRAIMDLRRLSQSDLARMAGVSRQAVSLWFKASQDTELNVRTPHLRKLSDALHIQAEDLLRSLLVLNDDEAVRKYETALLWDRLYPGLVDFSVALVHGEVAALARLVQVFGLYKASKIAGKKIWDRFPQYKKHIRPVRREQIEQIWQVRRQFLKSN
jgi:transcriptional regulator with XRE-family HTH domain